LFSTSEYIVSHYVKKLSSFRIFTFQNWSNASDW